MERFRLYLFCLIMLVLLIIVFFLTYRYMKTKMGPNAPVVSKKPRPQVVRRNPPPSDPGCCGNSEFTETAVSRRQESSAKADNNAKAEISAIDDEPDRDAEIADTVSDTTFADNTEEANTDTNSTEKTALKSDDRSAEPVFTENSKIDNSENDDISSEISDLINNINCNNDEGDKEDGE